MRVDVPAAVTGVTLAVPEGWYLLPRGGGVPSAGNGTGTGTGIGTGDGTGQAEWVRHLRPVMADLAAEAARAGVSMCAFGPLDEGRLGAACVLVVRDRLPAGEMSAEAERLAAGDPGTQPVEEVCWLELAGPAGRLSWTPQMSDDGRRSACVQFYVPFPGDDDRVAILTCSAIGADPGERAFAELDSLAATVCFSTSFSTGGRAVPAAGVA